VGVALLLIRISANNWRLYGSIFGGNEIVRLMLSQDVVMLGFTDVIMCASTVFCLFLQNIIAGGYLSWNKSGWMLQNVCLKIFVLVLVYLIDFSLGMATSLSFCVSRISSIPRLAMDALRFHQPSLYHHADEATQLRVLQWSLYVTLHVHPAG
jgi:hypothetical protein